MKSKHTHPTVFEQDTCENHSQENPHTINTLNIKDLQYVEVLIATGATVFIYDIATKTYRADLLTEQATDENYVGYSLDSGLISQGIIREEDVEKLKSSIQSIADGLSKHEVHTIKVRNKKEYDHWFRIQLVSVDNSNSKPSELLMIINDVHDQIISKEIRYREERDPLTGLYNREAFFRKTAKIIKAHEPGSYVIACFDVSNFKVINDQYGIHTGDKILQNIAKIFRNGFHPIGGICCRVMADNFALLYPAKFIDSPEIKNIRKKIADPNIFELPLSFSVGRYIINDLSLPISAMYDRAAIAEVSVKGRFDMNTAYYNESMRQNLLQEQELTSEMTAALEAGQFELWFQPQYNHSSGRLIGAEALVRWNHPQKGIIQPGVFIPVFEKNGFIYNMDKYVWEQACIFLRKQLAFDPSPIPISVNISRHDIFQKDFYDFITSLIKKYEIPIHLLHLEITESAFAKSTEQIISMVTLLKNYGFTIEIDDFGSGYSSLNTLKDVPANVLKLDMRFLENSSNSQKGGNILSSMVRMAKWLGMTVIAEGVESREQADYLKSIGCYYIQGYLYAKPMPVAAFENLLSKTDKERETAVLETVDTLDNNAFWDPSSMDTLIFNSYVGGACIFEYSHGKIEILRANDKYAEVIGGKNLSVEEAISISLVDCVYKDSLKVAKRTIKNAIKTEHESSCELVLHSVHTPNKDIHIRCNMRVIARTLDRHLFYCTVENVTAQRKIEETERETSAQIMFLNEISSKVLSTGDTVSTINEILYKILEYFDGNRAYIFEFDYEKLITNNTYEVCAHHSLPMIDMLQNLPLDLVSLWLNAFAEKNHIYIESVDTLDESRKGEREILQAQNIESLVAVPLRRDGILIGFMGVDDPRQNHSHVSHLEAIGDYMAVILTRRDLTSKIQGDNEVLTELMNDTPGGFARIKLHSDNTFSMIFANDGFCKLVGMSQDEVKATYGINAAWGIHPDDLKNTLAGAENAIKSTGVLTMPCRLRCKNDEYIALTLFARLSKSPSGELFFNVYYADMAEQGKIEAHRRELLDNLPCGAGIYKLEDGQLSVVYLNNRYRELVGRPLDDLSQTPVMEAVHPDDRERLWNELFDAMNKGHDAVCDIRIIQGDGSYRPFRTVCRIVIQDENNAISYTTYTPISSDEMAFREMLPIALAAVMESSTDLSFVKDKNLNYICCSRAFADMVGLENESKVVGKSDYDLFDEHLAEQYRIDDYAVIQGGKSLVDYVERIPSEDGSLRYSSTSKHLLHDSQGNIIGLFGVGRDITKNREAYERLKLLSDNIPGGLALYALTADGVSTVYLSDGIYALTGYDKETYDQLTMDNPLSIIFEEDLPAVHAQIDQLRRGADSVNCQYRIHTKDGSYRWLNLKGLPSEPENGKITINSVILDITEQKAKEESLRRQEEMEERLRVSEEELKLAMSQIGKMVCVYDVPTMTLTLPLAYAQKHNLPQMIPDTPSKQMRSTIIDDATLPGFVEMFHKILAGEKTGSTDINIVCSDKTICRERGEFVTIFDRNGSPVRAIISVEDITAEHERDTESNELRQNEQIFRLVATHSNRSIYNYEVATRSAKRYTPANPSFYSFDEIKNLPDSIIDNGSVLSESIEDCRQIFCDIHNGIPYGNVKIHVCIDGSINWIDVQYSVIFSENNAPKSAVISLLDITEDHEKELAYDRYQQNMAEDSLQEGLIYFESNLTTNTVEKRGGNAVSLNIQDNTHDGIVLYGVNNLLLDDTRSKGLSFFSRENLISAFNQGIRTLTEEWHTLYKGMKWRWYRAQIQMIQDPYSNHIRAYTVLRDITCEKNLALDMERRGKIDGMTGLYNKTVTETLIQERLSRADNTPCALLIADLDNLKAINDNLGHDQGDQAIRIIADALRSQFRETDIVGRVGGDEFVAFLDGFGNELKLHSLMSAFRKKLSAFRIGENKNIEISSSVGIVISETGTTTYEEMFKMADKAMYYVKNNGKNDYAIYSPSMEHAVYQYTGRNTALVLKTNLFNEEELNHLLEAVSAVYPLIISVNLTQNSYYMLQYDNYTTKTCLDAGNFDELIAEGAKTFHENDRPSFLEAFLRENLLASYAAGKSAVSHEGRQIGDDGTYRYVRTDVIFVKGDDNEDVKEITLARELNIINGLK